MKLIAALLLCAAAQAQPFHMWTGPGTFVDPSGVDWTPNLCTGTLQFLNPGSFPTALYNSTAYTAAPGVPIVCTFPTAPGSYFILIHLIEAVHSFNATQRRVLNILANSQPILTGVDIFQRAGGVEIPYDVSATVASPGPLTITFTQVKSSAIFAGIEIFPASPPVPQFADNEVPAPTADRAVFTLANAPNPPQSLHLTLSGVELHNGVDYTLVGNTITYSGILVGNIVVVNATGQPNSNTITTLIVASAAPAGAVPVVGTLVPMVPGTSDVVFASYRY